MDKITTSPYKDETASLQFDSSARPAFPSSARWLALGAFAGLILFTLAWFILGFMSPGYTILILRWRNTRR